MGCDSFIPLLRRHQSRTHRRVFTRHTSRLCRVQLNDLRRQQSFGRLDIVNQEKRRSRVVVVQYFFWFVDAGRSLRHNGCGNRTLCSIELNNPRVNLFHSHVCSKQPLDYSWGKQRSVRDGFPSMYRAFQSVFGTRHLFANHRSSITNLRLQRRI